MCIKFFCALVSLWYFLLSHNWSKIPKYDDELSSWLVIVIFSTRRKKKSRDYDNLGLLLSFSLPKGKNVENDNELKNLLSSSAIKAKQSRTTTSWDLGSSSFFALEEKTKRQWRASWLIVIFYNWGKKFTKWQQVKMMTSWDPNSSSSSTSEEKE